MKPLGGGRAEPTWEPVLEPDLAQLVWQSSLQTPDPEPESEPEPEQLSRHASGLVSERNPPSTSASPSLEHIEERGVSVAFLGDRGRQLDDGTVDGLRARLVSRSALDSASCIARL